MGGHDITGWLNPKTGWYECACGKFTEPLEGEPHDEYSALCTGLVQKYYDELLRSMPTSRSSDSYREIQNANVRMKLAKLLAGATPQYVEALIKSLHNSNTGFDRHSDIMRLDASDLILFTQVGVHLDGNSRYLLESALVRVTRLEAPTGLRGGQRWDRLGAAVAANPSLARVMAALLDLLEVDYMPKLDPKDTYKLHESLAAVCLPLERREELLPVVAALYNERGYSEETTVHMLSIISSGITPHLALAEGLI